MAARGLCTCVLGQVWLGGAQRVCVCVCARPCVRRVQHLPSTGGVSVRPHGLRAGCEGPGRSSTLGLVGVGNRVGRRESGWWRAKQLLLIEPSGKGGLRAKGAHSSSVTGGPGHRLPQDVLSPQRRTWGGGGPVPQRPPLSQPSSAGADVADGASHGQPGKGGWVSPPPLAAHGFPAE